MWARRTAELVGGPAWVVKDEVMNDLRSLLARTADHVAAYREAASEAAVFPEIDLDAVRAAIEGPAACGPHPCGRGR